MSQNKHTPGPWEHVGDGDVMAPFDATDKWYVAIAYDGLPDGQHEANARLIAAAPDLLESLEAVIKVADRDTDVFNRAKAAIAKARGDHT